MVFTVITFKGVFFKVTVPCSTSNGIQRVRDYNRYPPSTVRRTKTMNA